MYNCCVEYRQQKSAKRFCVESVCVDLWFPRYNKSLLRRFGGIMKGIGCIYIPRLIWYNKIWISNFAVGRYFYSGAGLPSDFYNNNLTMFVSDQQKYNSGFRLDYASLHPRPDIWGRPQISCEISPVLEHLISEGWLQLFLRSMCIRIEQDILLLGYCRSNVERVYRQ